MENASKALLMAGSVLIGIALISIFVYVFRSGANFAQNYETTIGVRNVAAFNEQFEKYTQKQEITMYDIVSLVHYAQNYNEKNMLTPTHGIDIKVNNVSYLTKKREELTELIKKDTNKYKCDSITYNEENQLVNCVRFKTAIIIE